MDDDRTTYDPFAPPPAPPAALLGVVTPPEPVVDERGNEHGEPGGNVDERDNTSDSLAHDHYLSKAELVAMAQERGLDTIGTRADLMDRIRADEERS